jgi:hypothetical protein
MQLEDFYQLLQPTDCASGPRCPSDKASLVQLVGLPIVCFCILMMVFESASA